MLHTYRVPSKWHVYVPFRHFLYLCFLVYCIMFMFSFSLTFFPVSSSFLHILYAVTLCSDSLSRFESHFLFFCFSFTFQLFIFQWSGVLISGNTSMRWNYSAEHLSLKNDLRHATMAVTKPCIIDILLNILPISNAVFICFIMFSADLEHNFFKIIYSLFLISIQILVHYKHIVD